MFSLSEVIIAIFLAYYWTGYDMVLFHTQLGPINQPVYARGPVWKRAGAVVLWPFAAYANREFAWFSICFLSSAIILGAAYIGLNYVIGSTFFAIFILGALRIIPMISNLVSLPLALLSTLLWFLIAKPLGCKPPIGMDRLNR